VEGLFLDYQRNEVAADQKYRGRRLLVAGMVTSLNKDFTDKVYLMLRTSNMFMGVHADLEPSEVARTGELSQGERSPLCSGDMMIVGSPMLDNCVFHNAPVENDAPRPIYSTQPSHEQQQATVPVINATSVPGGAFVQMSFKIAADGRVYHAVVNTPSRSRAAASLAGTGVAGLCIPSGWSRQNYPRAGACTPLPARFEAIPWLSCQGRSLAQTAGELACQVGLKLDGELDSVVRQLTGHRANKRCLLVLDNVEQGPSQLRQENLHLRLCEHGHDR
jgi:tRNA_anti-like